MNVNKSEQIHATCIALDGRGVLLRGPSGSGKSDMALRLIDAGAELVADDRVDLDAPGRGRRGGIDLAAPDCVGDRHRGHSRRQGRRRTKALAARQSQ